MNTIDILCVGAAAYDLTFVTSHHPREDEKMVADEYYTCGGGPAANAAVAAKRLGCSTAFAGYLGDDIYGNMHFNELVSEGVLTEWIIRGNHPTTFSVSIVKNNGRRSLINYRGRTPYLEQGSIGFRNIKPKIILFDGHEPNLSPELIDFCRKNNVTTILDAGSLHKGTEYLMDKTDYLICSQVFAEQFSGTKDMPSALEILSGFSSAVIITLGENGLLWKRGDETGDMPAYTVNTVDTTGAGDAFHGAFAASLIKGMDFEESLRFSSIAAALTCTKIGGRNGLPYIQDIKDLVWKKN